MDADFIGNSTTPPAVTDPAACGRVGDWPWHRRNRFRQPNPQRHAATDCEAVRPSILESYCQRNQVRAVLGDPRRQLPCPHYPRRRRHHYRPGHFRFLTHRRTFRRGCCPALYLRQRAPRNVVLRNANTMARAGSSRETSQPPHTPVLARILCGGARGLDIC